MLLYISLKSQHNTPPPPQQKRKENKIELTQRNWKSGKYLKWKVKKNEPQQLKSCTVVTTRKSRAREKSMRMNEWVVGCLMMHGCWLLWVGEWCIYIYVWLVVVEKESALFCLHRSGSCSPLKDDNVTFEFDETFVYIFISPTDKFMLCIYVFFCFSGGEIYKINRHTYINIIENTLMGDNKCMTICLYHVDLVIKITLNQHLRDHYVADAK